MIKLKCQYECWKHYQFRPNHDRRRIFGSFSMRSLESRYEIWSLKIIDKYQGNGYGTQMLIEFLQQFNHDKPLFLYVWKTNEIAIRLYKKVGFVITRDSHNGAAYEMQYMPCS